MILGNKFNIYLPINNINVKVTKKCILLYSMYLMKSWKPLVSQLGLN